MSNEERHSHWYNYTERQKAEENQCMRKQREENLYCQYNLWCERKRNSYSARNSFKACCWDKIMQMWTFTAVHTEHCKLWSLRVWELNLQSELDHSLLPHNRTPLYRRSNPGGREKRERREGRKKWRGFYRALRREGRILAEGIVMSQTHDMTWCLYSSLHLFFLLKSLCTCHMWVFCTCLLISLNSRINCTKMSIRKRKTASFLIFSS